MPETDPARTGQGLARQRLRDAFLRPSRAQGVVGVLLAVLGFALVTQVRANRVDDDYASFREENLISLLKTLSRTAQRAEGQIARLEDRRVSLQDRTKRNSAALAQAQEAADTLSVLSGQVPVSGPGIRITITEGDGESVSVNSLLDTIQELRAAGAEGMEFNDEVRVVAQTAFSPVAEEISVGGVTLSSPYTLEVIGDPRTLNGALTFPQGPIDQLEGDGATVEVETLKEIEIRSVHEPEPLEYAEGDPEQ